MLHVISSSCQKNDLIRPDVNEFLNQIWRGGVNLSYSGQQENINHGGAYSNHFSLVGMKTFLPLMIAPRGGYIIGEVASGGNNDMMGAKRNWSEANVTSSLEVLKA